MNKNNIIYLIGFSGSGKSTVGPKLADRLKYRYYDIDSLIEKKTKMTIDEIFKNKNEKYFRYLEQETIKEITENRYNKKVIALGGGAFQSADTRKLIIKNGVSIYLSCSQRELYNRMSSVIDRPLLNSVNIGRKDIMLKIQRMLSKRRYNYNKADLTVSTTSKSVTETVKEILNKLKR